MKIGYKITLRTLLALFIFGASLSQISLANESKPEQIRVQIKSASSRQQNDSNNLLNGNVASFQAKGGNLYLKGRVGIIPSMTRTKPVIGGVKSEIVKPEVYRAWLKNTYPQFFLKASSLAPNTVVVVKGQWDNSARTLKKLGVKHKRVSARQFSQLSLANTKVVIVDCEGGLDRKSKQKLRTYVLRGGYLLSTDWDLDGFVSTTFPGYITWNKGINRRLIYDAIVVDADPILFKNTVTNAPWKLDQESHLIRVLNNKKVRILIRSKILSAEDPDRLGALAVSFGFGRGFVLHMAGHFDNNSGIPIKHRLPDPAPVIQMSLRQALAINFLVAGLTSKRIPIRLVN